MAQLSRTLAKAFAQARQRVDYILIWGHGLVHEEKILDILLAEPGFVPLHILRYRPQNIRKLVRAVYSYDYAPFHHLESKTRYLMTTPAEVLFVFMLNETPEEIALGKGAFRHIECAKIKALKSCIRERFNPRQPNIDEPSEDHVIHASDNSAQTEYILNWLGIKLGVNTLLPHPCPFLQVRPHLPRPNEILIRQVELADLGCNLLEGSRWEFRVRSACIKDSPHYRAIAEGRPEIYAEYLGRFRGTGLRDPYSVSHYLALVDHLDYLAPPHETDYVLLQETHNGSMRIIDGLHRAAILYYRDKKATILGAISR